VQEEWTATLPRYSGPDPEPTASPTPSPVPSPIPQFLPPPPLPAIALPIPPQLPLASSRPAHPISYPNPSASPPLRVGVGLWSRGPDPHPAGPPPPASDPPLQLEARPPKRRRAGSDSAGPAAAWPGPAAAGEAEGAAAGAGGDFALADSEEAAGADSEAAGGEFQLTGVHVHDSDGGGGAGRLVWRGPPGLACQQAGDCKELDDDSDDSGPDSEGRTCAPVERGLRWRLRVRFFESGQMPVLAGCPAWVRPLLYMQYQVLAAEWMVD
jgi:hypothetical protein